VQASYWAKLDDLAAVRGDDGYVFHVPLLYESILS